VATPVLIRAVPWMPDRVANAHELRRITGGRIIWDRDRDPTTTFIEALRTACHDAEWHQRGTIHLEDDAILTEGWRAKAEACLRLHRDDVIQFFSMRKSDLDRGSRRESCRTFASTLCFYVPPRLAADVALGVMERPLRHGDPRTIHHAYDYALADFLASRRESYHLHVPSLADHQATWQSATNASRRRGRSSPSFVP